MSLTVAILAKSKAKSKAQELWRTGTVSYNNDEVPRVATLVSEVFLVSNEKANDRVRSLAAF